MKKISNHKPVHYGYIGLAFIAIGYTACSLIESTALNRFVNEGTLIEATVGYIALVIVVLYFSLRTYGSIKRQKPSQPKMKTSPLIRVGFVGSGFVIVAVIVAVVSLGLTDISLIGSLSAAEVFLIGTYTEINLIMNIIEFPENPAKS